jgi:hypothetical protein
MGHLIPGKTSSIYIDSTSGENSEPAGTGNSFVLLCPVTSNSALDDLSYLSDDAVFANLRCNSAIYYTC